MTHCARRCLCADARTDATDNTLAEKAGATARPMACTQSRYWQEQQLMEQLINTERRTKEEHGAQAQALAPAVDEAALPSKSRVSSVTVNITKRDGGFGMYISTEGVVSGYSVLGGPAEVQRARTPCTYTPSPCCAHAINPLCVIVAVPTRTGAAWLQVGRGDFKQRKLLRSPWALFLLLLASLLATCCCFAPVAAWQ
jgi:hypothetical protein